MPVAQDRLEIKQVLKLLQCVRNGELEQIEKLVKNGIPYIINYTEPHEGLAALHLAAVANNETLIQLLLDLGAHPDVVDFQGKSSAMLAAQYGHLEALKLLLAANASMKIVDKLGKGILFGMLTATDRHAKCLDLVLDHGAEVNNVSKSGLPLLVNVCQKATLLEDMCQKLLERGAEPNSQNVLTGKTAVMAAAASGSSNIVKALLEGGADPNCIDHQQSSAVLEASKGGFFDVLIVLAGYKANFDVLDKKLNTPLHYAALGGFAKCCRYLVQRGCNAKLKNGDGFTPRMIAKDLSYKDVVKECKKAETLSTKLRNDRSPVENWALNFYDWLQVNKTQIMFEFTTLDETNSGTVSKEDFLNIMEKYDSPLTENVYKNFFLIVDPIRSNLINYNELIKGAKYIPKNFSLVSYEPKKKKTKKKKGKKPNLPLPICICPEPLRTANGAIPGGIVNKYEFVTDVVRFNRDDPLHLPSIDDTKWYLEKQDEIFIHLYEAIKEGDLKTIQNALDNGTPVDVRDRFYKTPLMIACRYANIDSVRFFLEQGAKVNITDNFMWTPLHHAIIAGIFDVVKLLVEHGAHIEAKTLDGSTPLMKAIEVSNYEMVKCLMENGAKIWNSDRSGRPIMALALEFADPRVYSFLYKYYEDHPPPVEDLRKRKDDKKKARPLEESISVQRYEQPSLAILDASEIFDEKRFINNETVRAYVNREREVIEDIRFTPAHGKEHLPTTAELVEKKEIKRQRFGYSIDFPDYVIPFNQNIAKKEEQLLDSQNTK